MLTSSFSMFRKLSRFPGMSGSNSSVIVEDRIDCFGREVVVIQLADKKATDYDECMCVMKVGFINDPVVNEWTVSDCCSNCSCIRPSEDVEKVDHGNAGFEERW